MNEAYESNEERNAPDLTPVEARQGSELGRMRYVLGISMALVVALFLAVLWYFFGQS